MNAAESPAGAGELYPAKNAVGVNPDFGGLSKDTIDLLMKSIDILELPTRTSNCLHAENIYTVGDLIQRTNDDLIKIPNFGKKSLGELRHVLAARGLHLGARLDHFSGRGILQTRRSESIVIVRFWRRVPDEDFVRIDEAILTASDARRLGERLIAHAVAAGDAPKDIFVPWTLGKP